MSTLDSTLDLAGRLYEHELLVRNAVEAFHEVDKNGDREVSPEELRAWWSLPKTVFDDLWERVDKNKSGSLSCMEFVELYQFYNNWCQGYCSQCEKLLLNSDKSARRGSQDEILCSHCFEQVSDPTEYSVYEAAQPAFGNLLSAEIGKEFERLDVDKDGSVTLKELEDTYSSDYVDWYFNNFDGDNNQLLNEKEFGYGLIYLKIATGCDSCHKLVLKDGKSGYECSHCSDLILCKQCYTATSVTDHPCNLPLEPLRTTSFADLGLGVTQEGVDVEEPEVYNAYHPFLKELGLIEDAPKKFDLDAFFTKTNNPDYSKSWEEVASFLTPI
ncbi:hypothetical protein K493DRAFT_333478 [Basidiobolus meristosporus CBS 931.73]|uniref:EF-hand domain-containing protein n=1 Tax=Basidiobolus meristosporus CBS 931.73 TaxID=1314790 RepID=A0A1Y1Z5U7_9FUNG|nr:hypothetical protein K493DRAFT_333478 [Basidiobolus meristosporus CBS 931.73]|eukprot:ORY05662.1 hypothetical protein K493DRAFT_333478 [Basidiobolus meristosporus CBS 931.73]